MKNYQEKLKNKKNLNINTFLKKGDQVKIISGEKKGFLGTINSVISKKSSIILEGILPRIKYIKNTQVKSSEDQENKGKNENSKKIELPILIHFSNVMLWDKQINKVSRIGYKEVSENESTTKLIKKRYFKKSGNFVP